MDSNPQRAALKGVFPVLATPFHDDGSVDAEGFRNVINMNLQAGADGVVYPANASEFETLAPDERTAMLDLVFERVAGRVPIIAGASAAEPAESIVAAADAAARGAAAVMVMPARAFADDIAALNAMFDGVSAAGIPVIFQNAPAPQGPGLHPDVILALLRENPQIRYVKEETLPSGWRITKLLAEAPETLAGVFGGAGGRFILDELARGAVGTMPSSECTEIHKAVFDAWSAGDEARAREVFGALLPLLVTVSMVKAAGVKEIMRQRGIIGSARVRARHLRALDAIERAELSANLATITPLLTTGAQAAADRTAG